MFTKKLDEIEELKAKVIELKYIKDKEETIDAYQKQLEEKLEMLKDHLVMLQQESKVNCTEDESSKRHIREEQETIYNVTKRRN